MNGIYLTSYVMFLQAHTSDFLKSLEAIFREELSMSWVLDMRLDILHATNIQSKYFQICAWVSYTQLFNGDTEK